MAFKPKWLQCNQESVSYKHVCTSGNEYRWNNVGVNLLIKNKEDYDEMLALPQFDAGDGPHRVRGAPVEAKKSEKPAKDMAEEKEAEEPTSEEE